jgi:ketosteroid isomerase-like protein
MRAPQVKDWLDRYVAAWASYDRAAIEDLFTPDTEYSYHPYDSPVVGARAIADDWLADQDASGSWQAEYHPHLVQGNSATATGKTIYTDGKVYWNLWDLAFDDDGRCTRFVEWYMRQPDS